MKTRVLTPRFVAFCCMAIVACMVTRAQSFVIDRTDPNPVLTTTALGIPTHNGMFTNTSSTTKNVVCRYFCADKSINHGIASLCTDVCRELPYNFLGAPYDLPPFPLEANASLALKALIQTEGQEGTSTLRFLFFDQDNPSDSVSYETTFIVSAVTSVRDISEVADVEVGPNPSSDFVTMTSPMLIEVNTVDAYDAYGRIVLTQLHDGSNRTSVDVSSLPVGAYNVVLTLNSGVVYRTPISVIR